MIAGCRLPLLAALLALSHAPSAGDEAVVTKRVGRLTIHVDAGRAVPGGFFVVRFESRRRLGRLTAIFEGRRAASFDSTEGLRALVPIPLATPPGAWTLGVELAARRGVQRMTLEVPVAPRAYAERRAVSPPLLPEGGGSRAAGVDGRRLMLLVRTESPDRSWEGGFTAPVEAPPAPDSFGARMPYEPALPVERSRDGAWGDRRRSLEYPVAPETRVAAPAGGQVLFAGELALPGRTVVIDHGQGLVSALQHLGRVDVAAGERVSGGQAIGVSGASGLAPGPQLAWSLHLHGIAIDPRLAIERLR